MSNEITNQAIELSADELDVVNGGAAFLDESAIFAVSKNSIASSLSVGPNGVTSLTAASDLDIFSAATKQLGVF
jgi:predicted secreted protein